MPGLEGIIRPFANQDVTPTPIRSQSPQSAPLVRFAVGVIGGTKTFSYSGSSSLTSYMAEVHTEKNAPNFDLASLKAKG